MGLIAVALTAGTARGDLDGFPFPLHCQLCEYESSLWARPRRTDNQQYCRRAALSRWGLARYFIRQGE